MSETNPLPQEFGSAAPLTDGMALLRTQVLERLKEEAENDSMIDLMLAERVSYIYAFVRQKEAVGIGSPSGFDHLRNWRESNAMLLSSLDSMRKKRTKDQSLDDARAEILTAATDSVKKAISFLPIEQQAAILQNMVEEFGDGRT